MATPTIALVLIGSELLAGRIADRNGPYLARRLYELGADLGRVEILPDRVEALASALRPLSEAFDYVLTTGGLGPAPGDVTMAGLASAFNQTVIRHTFLENLLSHRYGGEELHAARARLAEVPDQARILVRQESELPQVVVGNVYPFPGRPERLRQSFEAVADLFRGEPRSLRQLTLEGEETLATPVLNRAVRLHPEVFFGAHPNWEEGSKLLLTLESRDPEAADRACDFLLGALPPGMEATRIG